MPWFKVDDGFWRHPKVMDLPDAAVALWTKSGSWSSDQLTDGEVPKTAMRLVNGRPKAADALVDAGLWKPTLAGWEFHDWADYQPTRTQVRQEREATAERVRQWRAKRKGRGTDDPPDLASVPSA
jgi:hypothetical protein